MATETTDTPTKPLYLYPKRPFPFNLYPSILFKHYFQFPLVEYSTPSTLPLQYMFTVLDNECVMDVDTFIIVLRMDNESVNLLFCPITIVFYSPTIIKIG